MNKKSVAAIIVVIVAIIIIALAASGGKKGADYSNSQDLTPNGGTGTSAPSESINPNAGGTTPEATDTNTSASYTMAQVSTHSGASSCWTAINGGVYDVTTWVNQHPGGKQAILSLCGKDGSAFFNGQHGGQARPASELAGFKIGALAQ